MRNILRRFLGAVAMLLVLGPALAQQAEAAADAADAALSSWQRAAATEGRARIAALRRMAAQDDPRITEALLVELRRVGSDPYVEHVLDAIGLRPRGTALADLRDALQRRGASVPIRTAAARAIGRQGNSGIDLLLELARADADRVEAAVRTASMVGLAAAGDERAWRGLAPLALRGTKDERLAVLRLLEPARDVRAVTKARLRLLTESDSLLAAAAWRQLAAEHHPKARTAFDDLVERVGPAPLPSVRVELVLGLGYGMRADAYAPFLRFAALDHPHVQTAVGMVAGGLAGDAAFVKWLVTEALDGAVGIERKVALAIVQKAPADVLRPLLQRIRAGLDYPTKASLELALATVELLAQDARWSDDVRKLLSAADPEVRTAGFALLLELGLGDAVQLAQGEVDSKQWQLRAAAYRYLTRFRALSSIPILIARLDKEDGQLAQLVGEALFVHTGVRRRERAEWEAWWRSHGSTHVLPVWESVHSAGADNGTGTTVAYYGIAVASKHSMFLIDVSGSMLTRLITGTGRTRLDEAKWQLRQVVEKLPEDHSFGFVAYEGVARSLWPALHRATADAKKQVLEMLDELVGGWTGTNIHEALELAFRDPEVDTIYLLSDGQPNVGRITEPNALANEVRRWNYSRRIVVHCIAVGEESELLRRLADESGGRYVLVQ